MHALAIIAETVGAAVNTVAPDNLQSLQRTRAQLTVRRCLISSLTTPPFCSDFFFVITQLNDLVVLI